jgi:hypothetical protein
VLNHSWALNGSTVHALGTRVKIKNIFVDTGTWPKVRQAPSWPRRWANFSLLWRFSHRNARANLHLSGQPDNFLAEGLDLGA